MCWGRDECLGEEKHVLEEINVLGRRNMCWGRDRCVGEEMNVLGKRNMC